MPAIEIKLVDWEKILEGIRISPWMTPLIGLDEYAEEDIKLRCYVSINYGLFLGIDIMPSDNSHLAGWLEIQLRVHSAIPVDSPYALKKDEEKIMLRMLKRKLAWVLDKGSGLAFVPKDFMANGKFWKATSVKSNRRGYWIAVKKFRYHLPDLGT